MKSAKTAGVRPDGGACLNVGALSQAVGQAMRGMSWQNVRPAVYATSGAVILGSVLATGPSGSAVAQEAEEAALEEITVTGSRIRRQDFTANSPITTVDEAFFDETASVGVETMLNRLPQFVPAVTQFTTTDVQQTATNTVGASTVSLRGLGPNRNLVLINGRRAMPVGPTMVVDTNSIPAAAIERVEVISGGASAVYGADAVGGVVNFILKDDYEGATVDVRVHDTQHGGNQEITISGIVGANMAGDRGNVMMGVERATRSKQHQWERDWRVADFANPNTNTGFFVFGSNTWFSETPVFGNFFNAPTQAAIDAIFPVPAAEGTPISPFGTNFRVNRDGSGTLFTGSGFFQNAAAPGSYRYTGQVYPNEYVDSCGLDNAQPIGGDDYGEFPGLPVRVVQPNCYIKENNLYTWASTPLERLSAFADGHFDISDSVKVTAQAMVSRTQTESSLGLTAANINQWGAPIPFGDEVYRGNADPRFNIPDSLIDVNGNGVADAGDMTNPGFTERFEVTCDGAPTATMPWLDGLPGCTNSEAWPTSADVYNLYSSRPIDPNAVIWASRPPDYLRNALGAGRSTTNTTTTMNFQLGLEGELPSGNDFWDVTLSTGRSDNLVQQNGSIRLSTYRDVLAFPNFGRNALFDQNPFEPGSFAEGTPTCTTGLPIMGEFVPSADCVAMIAPTLKNEQEVTQTVLEANLVGDLVEMPAGPLQYALGLAYRENSFLFSPDNLSLNENEIDPIAGLFPNEVSSGEFDVSELYGELLVPIVSDGPTGVEHFIVELGGRVSDWSMPEVNSLQSYKALIDWGITPRYRLRGGFNRAHRAPNLGELFQGRTQAFANAGAVFGDHCSQNLLTPSPFGATPQDWDPVTMTGTVTPQNQRAEAICRILMGEALGAPGAAEFYENQPITDQPSGAGGAGLPNTFGNPNLHEERADTWTLGVVMDFLENWTLTVDYYEIEVTDMISAAPIDSIYQRCMDPTFNPAAANAHLSQAQAIAAAQAAACQQIFRNPSTGGSGTVDRSYDNEGRALMSGVDLQLNWSTQLANGGFSINSVMNYSLEAVTQASDAEAEIDHAGFNSCALGIQCQAYDYRLFTTFSYFRGPWNVSLRHQHWPSLDDVGCRTAADGIACLNNSLPSHNLFSLAGSYTFADHYSLRVGIDNLFDEDPPCVGANPTPAPFPEACTHDNPAGPDRAFLYNSTYDPLGRRYFVSMQMDF